MKTIQYRDISRKPRLHDVVTLKRQEQKVVRCEETKVLMLNIDADDLSPGDLTFIKQLGLTISNPDTARPVALGVDIKKKKSFGSRLATWFETDDYDDDSFFGSTPTFGGSSSFGGFSGGFGGFGGGGFGGGGASRGF